MLAIIVNLFKNKGGILDRKKEAGTKVLASQLSLDCRARRSFRVGSTTLISSAFIALLNCLFYFFKGWDNGTSDQNRCNNFDK